MVKRDRVAVPEPRGGRRVNLHDDDERWFENVAIVREVWNQRGRILGTEQIYRRHWRGRDADPQWSWVCEKESSKAFYTLHEAQEWTNSAWNALHVARAQRLHA